jgi:hypothetical protein
MAEGDENTPILDELLGVETDQAKFRTDGLGSEIPGRHLTMAEQESLCAPLHRMHERRLVRSAGRMVVGFRMPTPYSLGDRMEPVGLETPVFSSALKRPRAGASRIAISVACAVALGTTAVVTGFIGPQEPAGGPTIATAGTSTPAERERSFITEVASTESIQDVRPVTVMAISCSALRGSPSGCRSA